MAKNVPGEKTPVASAPSFSAAVDQASADRAAHLDALAAAEPIEKPEVSAEPSGSPKTIDLDAEWGKIPEDVRSAIAERLYGDFSNGIREQYADIAPLIAEAQNNPQLRRALKEFADDEDARKYLAREDAYKQIKRLSDDKFRDYIYGDPEHSAAAYYDKYNQALEPQGQASGQPTQSAESQRLAALEQRLDGERDQAETQNYYVTRNRELHALYAVAPGLQQPEYQKQVEHLLTIAEDRFALQAQRAGIDTTAQNWQAKAVRSGIKAPSYKAVYDEQASRPMPPPAAPAGSSGGRMPAPARGKPPQAPRSASDARRTREEATADGAAALRNLRKKIGR